MDFYQIRSKEMKDKSVELYPDFIVGRSQDLMVQGLTPSMRFGTQKKVFGLVTSTMFNEW